MTGDPRVRPVVRADPSRRGIGPDRHGRRGAAAMGVALALSLVLSCVLAGAAGAAAAEDSYAYDLAGELMSPFCPGRTLASCPSPQAGELIQWIALQESAGASRDEVKAMLVERYGEEILGAPPAEGVALWAYVLPVAGFLVGGIVAAIVLGRLVRRPVEAESPTTAVETATSIPASAMDDELARRVDDELEGRIRVR